MAIFVILVFIIILPALIFVGILSGIGVATAIGFFILQEKWRNFSRRKSFQSKRANYSSSKPRESVQNIYHYRELLKKKQYSCIVCGENLRLQRHESYPKCSDHES